MTALFIGLMSLGTFFAVRATLLLRAMTTEQIDVELGGPTST